jgi:hypothetical protein
MDHDLNVAQPISFVAANVLAVQEAGRNSFLGGILLGVAAAAAIGLATNLSSATDDWLSRR